MIIKITLLNDHHYIICDNSIDRACYSLLKYLNYKDLYFTSERKIKEIKIIAEKIDDDDYDNIYEIIGSDKE